MLSRMSLEAEEPLEWSGSETDSRNNSRPASRQQHHQGDNLPETDEEEPWEEGKVYYVG